MDEGTDDGQGGGHGRTWGGAGRERGKDKNGEEEATASGACRSERWKTSVRPRIYFCLGPAPGEPCPDERSLTADRSIIRKKI